MRRREVLTALFAILLAFVVSGQELENPVVFGSLELCGPVEPILERLAPMTRPGDEPTTQTFPDPTDKNSVWKITSHTFAPKWYYEQGGDRKPPADLSKFQMNICGETMPTEIRVEDNNGSVTEIAVSWTIDEPHASCAKALEEALIEAKGPPLHEGLYPNGTNPDTKSLSWHEPRKLTIAHITLAPRPDTFEFTMIFACWKRDDLSLQFKQNF